jgi:hypothetical protein
MVGISEFKSRIQDLARPNRFEVNIPGIINAGSEESLLCINAEIPGLALSTGNTYDTNHAEYGSIMPSALPYDVVIKPLGLTFTDTRDYKVRKAFDKWIDLIFDQKKGFGYLEDYAKSVFIWGLARDGEAVYGIRLDNAYPIAIDEIALDAAAADSYVSFGVQITYNRYEIL